MRLCVACAAVPALIGLVVAGAAAPLFWRGGSLNLAEAAALRDAGEAVRLIASGADPNATYPLRPGILAAESLTPLEAAVGARRAEMVELLMLHGAKVDLAGWRRLNCFAQKTGATDVVTTLDHFAPATARASCEGISTPF